MRLGGESMGLSSNIATDRELMMRFNIEATAIANSLRNRFYPVFDEMDVEDVVSECWRKIISQNISYNPDKSKFSTFVYMIVNSKLLDLVRKYTGANHVRNRISLDVSVVYENSVSPVPMYDLVANKRVEDPFKIMDITEEIQEYVDLFNDIPHLKEILNMFVEGYPLEWISNKVGVDYGTICLVKSVMKRIHNDRKNGTAVPMSNILYYESQDWQWTPKETDTEETIKKRKQDEKRWSLLIDFSSLIKDDLTGINLSRIIRLILRSFTYEGISEKLGIGRDRVDYMLNRYDPILI